MKFTKENLHHAYICTGDKEQVLESVLSFIEGDLGISTKGNPDVMVLDFDTLGIEDARRINEAHLKKAIVEDKMIFVISFNSATVEAQNSLLKMFEEPTQHTHFFAITTPETNLLPTLLSRVQLEKMQEIADEEIDELSKRFLSSNKSERLILLKDIIETKDKVRANKLLNKIEKNIYLDTGHKEVQMFEIINLCRKYINDRGASVKMLMEYLALSV